MILIIHHHSVYYSMSHRSENFWTLFALNPEENYAKRKVESIQKVGTIKPLIDQKWIRVHFASITRRNCIILVSLKKNRLSSFKTLIEERFSRSYSLLCWKRICLLLEIHLLYHSRRCSVYFRGERLNNERKVFMVLSEINQKGTQPLTYLLTRLLSHDSIELSRMLFNARFLTKRRCSSRILVIIGEVFRVAIHCLIAERSYVNPSEATWTVIRFQIAQRVK